MAITVTIGGLIRDVTSRRIHTGTLTTSGTYVTGGFAVTPANFGLGAIDRLALTPVSGYTFEYLPSTGLVIVYVSSAFTPTFTGSALAAHTHVLHFASTAATNAVTAEANKLRTTGAAFDVAGVATATGEGGIVQLTAGTPAGTLSATAAAALAELGGGTSLAVVSYFEAIGR